MAVSATTEFQAGGYTETGTQEGRRASAGSGRRSIIAPGIDQFFEIFYRFGLHLLLLGLLAFSCWTYIG